MYDRILVPIDGSPTSKHGLQESIRLAKLTGGTLRLMHVIDDMSIALSVDAYAGYAADWIKALHESGEQLLSDSKAMAASAGVDAQTLLLDNISRSVHELIVTEAANWPADLIVLGTHGRRGIGRIMMGSSAENVLRRSPVPVLLVRAPEPAEKPDDARGNDAGQRLHVSLPSGALSVE